MDDRTAGLYPFPGAILAAHTEIYGVIRPQTLLVRLRYGVHPGQIVGVYPLNKVLVAAGEFSGLVADHLFPACRVRLSAGDDVPIPHPHARAFQCQFPRVVFCSG